MTMVGAVKIEHKEKNTAADGCDDATTNLMITAFYWIVTERAVLISYGRFGTTYRSHLQGSRIQKEA
jgi:hypothetical protein